jgi:hypothetical protein
MPEKAHDPSCVTGTSVICFRRADIMLAAVELRGRGEVLHK